MKTPRPLDLALSALASLCLSLGLAATPPARPLVLPCGDPAAGGVGASVGPLSPAGKPPQCDLPADQRLHNKGGSDGSGLCVFTSISHAARWQNVRALQDFRDWMTHYPGGGYPEKVDRMILKKCQDAHVPAPDYVQVEGLDLEFLKLALRTGRMPSITYSRSPSGRYSGHRIAHMVSLAGYDGTFWCILDNNYPEAYEWLNDKEFTSVDPSWVVILLSPPPPPARAAQKNAPMFDAHLPGGVYSLEKNISPAE